MTTVLVVGARTTGLMMGIELARRGGSVRVIDKSAGIDLHVRASLIHSRTLEVLQDLGLAQKVIHQSFPEVGVCLYADVEYRGEIQHEPIDSPFPYWMSQSQAHTEEVLEQHLNSLGVVVERDVELVSLNQDAQSVRSRLKHPDGRTVTLETSWLVGCDGAHSTVRHQTGCGFPGEEDPFYYLLADVQVAGDLELNKGYVFLQRRGSCLSSQPCLKDVD